MRTTKTAVEHKFTKGPDGLWKLTGYESTAWYNTFSTDSFVMFVRGDALLINIPEDQKELMFRLDDEQEFTLGYDTVTDMVFLDVDRKSFMKRKNNFFRLQVEKKK
jgi:hypothetical protein